MNRALALLTLTVPFWLAGCSSQPAPQQPNSDTEVKSFALKILGASNMSDDLYAKYRRALTEPHEEGRSGS
ncbi:hypothetical protein [Pseudomonas sp. SCB32]|uniref:hypothetical protein n=1 Tax=Pseudomonas sp. SCB32 TaxID=2653853 RepID=UPI00126479B0|nr:hypothetical protein [Pseudomonas sp. SCB32]